MDFQFVKKLENVRCADYILTAKGEEWNRVNGLRMGADDYIVKPFSPGELVARMEAVLRRYTKQEQQEEIQFGPILINEKVDE